jgi:hypothetical protein
MSEFARIKTARSPSETQWVLTATENQAESSLAVQPAGSNLEETGQLWLLGSGVVPSGLYGVSSEWGYIVSAFNPNYVLGLGPPNQSCNNYSPTVVLVDRAQGDPTQLWQLQSAGQAGKAPQGFLVNKSNNLAVNLCENYLAATTPIILWPITAGARDNIWTIEPLGLPFDQPTAFQTALTFDGASSMVMTLQGNGYSPGTPAVLEALNTNSDVDPDQYAQYATNAGAMWQYSVDGYIESLLSSNLVLSLGPVDNGTQTVVAYPKAAGGNQPFQQWSVSAIETETDKLVHTVLKFVNLENNQYLTVSGGSTDSGTAVITAPDSGGSDQQWVASCGYPLEPILMQPPVPYPEYTSGDYFTAYQYASEHVRPPAPMSDGGLRALYALMSPGDASSYSENLVSPNLPQPTPEQVPTEAWNQTVKQLGDELSYVAFVQSLSSNIQNFLTKVLIQDSISIDDLAETFLVPSGNSSQNKLTETIEGVVMAGVNLIPEVGGCLATLMQTALNDAVNTGSIRTGAVQDAVADLQNALLSGFETLSSSVANLMTTVVNDWGKISAVGDLTNYPAGHPDSLLWNEASLEWPAVQGYQINILQTILPAAYKIWEWWDVPQEKSYSDFFDGSVPSGWQNGVQFWQEELPYNMYNFYVMAAGSLKAPGGQDVAQIKVSSSGPPTDVMQQYLYDRGVLPYNLFTGAGGWSGFTQTCGGAGTATGVNCQWTEIFNSSPLTLTITVTPNHGNILSWVDKCATASQTVPPYSECQFANWWNGEYKTSDECSANVTVYYSNQELIAFEATGFENGSPDPGITNVRSSGMSLTGGWVLTGDSYTPNKVRTMLVQS